MSADTTILGWVRDLVDSYTVRDEIKWQNENIDVLDELVDPDDYTDEEIAAAQEEVAGLSDIEDELYAIHDRIQQAIIERLGVPRKKEN